MRSIFVLREEDQNEILDPKNNIERLKRIRCLNLKCRSEDRNDRFPKVVPINKRRLDFKLGKKIA